LSVVIVGIIWRKPVLTHASIVCEGMLASVNSVNSNSLAGFKRKLDRHLRDKRGYIYRKH